MIIIIVIVIIIIIIIILMISLRSPKFGQGQSEGLRYAPSGDCRDVNIDALSGLGLGFRV